MGHKDLILSLENKINIDNPEYVETCRSYLSNVLDVLDKYNLTYTEEDLLGLTAHAYAMINRVKEREAVFEIDDELQSQVPDKYKQIANECIKTLKEKETILNESSEVFLIAVHIQKLMESEE